MEEVILDMRELEFSASDVGDVHIVGGWAKLLHFLSGEDVDGDQVNLCVTVLPGFGGAHFDDLARALFNDDVSVG